MKTERKSPTQIHETGAALAVSLILLLIMTVVGVAAMNGARLEVSVAGLRQDEEVALRGAERTVETVEAFIGQNRYNLYDASVAGFYLPETHVDASVTDWTAIDKIDADSNPGFDEHETLLLEYLGVMTLHGDSENVGGDQALAGSKVKAYRVTGRSDTDGKAVRIVETIYLKPFNALDPGE